MAARPFSSSEYAVKPCGIFGISGPSRRARIVIALRSEILVGRTLQTLRAPLVNIGEARDVVKADIIVTVGDSGVQFNLNSSDVELCKI